MGRTALLLVMGLGMAMSVISINISGTTERALQNNYTYFKYMNARNLARTAIHAALRGFDNNTNPDTTAIVTFNYGSYQIKSFSMSASPYDTIWMKSKGTYSDTSYQMWVQLYRSTKPFPTIGSALGVLATLSDFTMNGHPTIDGRNHTAAGDTTTSRAGDLPGVTVLSTTDSTTVAHAGGTDIIGVDVAGVVKREVVDHNPQPVNGFISEYENNYDYKVVGEIHKNSVLYGTAANPVIVYVDATAGLVEFAGATVGYGIMAVKGDVKFGGTFKWYGLIVVLGATNSVTFDESGTPTVIGGLIVAANQDPVTGAYGPASVTINGTGNKGKILYSSDTISNATNVGKLRYYSIVDWYE